MSITLFQGLQQAIQANQPVAWTALVETRGSTPQKAGAMMLVYPDGSQMGTLGGGCVEAEVKRRALRLLDDGQTELLTFQLDDNYGWDDGLICGGRMKMLVDPVRPGSDVNYFVQLQQLISAGIPCTEAVVIEPDKLPGTRGGDRYLLDRTGELLSARSNSPLPQAVREYLRDVKNRPRPYVDHGISYLPFLERCRLIIVGAGHVGQKVATLAAEVGFDIWVVDDREEYCNSERIPAAQRLIVGPIDQALSGLAIDSNTYCLIVTRGHNHDEEALYHLAGTSARYVGMIGSRRKIKLIFDDLLAEGLTHETLSRVHAPLGLEIGSQTVPEIAISIVAELIAHRNLGAAPAHLRSSGVLQEES